MRIRARQPHRGYVGLAQFRPHLEQHRRRVHVVGAGPVRELPPFAHRQETGRRPVTEPPAAKVHPDPQPVLLIGKQVHVVVPRPHRAKLLLGQLQEPPLRRELRGADALKHRIARRFTVLAPQPKADRLHDLIHHPRGVDGRSPQRRPHRQVPAADVVPHPRRRHVPRIGNRRADWRRIPHVVIGAQHPIRRLPQATVQLRYGPRIALAKDVNARLAHPLNLRPPICLGRSANTPRVSGDRQ